LRQLQQEMANAGFVTNDALTQEHKNAQNVQKKLESLIAQNKAFLDKLKLAQSDKQSLSLAKGKLDKTIERSGRPECPACRKRLNFCARDFDVALQVRSRLAQVQESMNGLIIRKGQGEHSPDAARRSYPRVVDDINQYLIEIRDNRISPKLVLSDGQEHASSVSGKKDTSRPRPRDHLFGAGFNDLKAQGQYSD